MKIEWKRPWEAVDDVDIAGRLVLELRREMSPGHVLFDVALHAIGRRQDNDDVAFALADGRFAVVHLTFSGRADGATDSPWTVLFESEETFVAQQAADGQAWRAAT